MPASGQDPTKVEARALYVDYGRAAHIPGGGALQNPAGVLARALYVDYGRAAHIPGGGALQNPAGLAARTVYTYYSRAHGQAPEKLAARALYTDGAWDETELFPWIERIAPTEQIAGGQLAIYGDGFGDTPAQEGSIVRLGSPPDVTQPGPGIALGIANWSSRSAGLHPANSGIRSSPAITATLPEEAESGMISVEQTE